MQVLTGRLLVPLSLLLILSLLLPAVLPVPAYASSTMPTAQVSSPAASFACTYVVRPGDDLFRIGLRFGVSFFVLAQVNGIVNFNLIFPGMVLRVPCANPPPVTTVCNIHFVQRGEFLMLIARMFGVSWQSIAAINHLINPNLIFPGERLLIPCP